MRQWVLAIAFVVTVAGCAMGSDTPSATAIIQVSVAPSAVPATPPGAAATLTA